MNKKKVCLAFILLVVLIVYIVMTFTYAHAQDSAEPSCADARGAEDQRYYDQMAELQQEVIDITKDYHNRLLLCKNDSGCRDEAKNELGERRRANSVQKNDEIAAHTKKKIEMSRACQRKDRQPVLKPLQPRLDPRTPDVSEDTTWTDAYGNQHPASNRQVFTTPEGKRFAFPKTTEIGGEPYDLDPSSMRAKRTASWQGWNSDAVYRNRLNPEDRTSLHGTLIP